MDFFKSCKTNVQHIDDLWKTPTTTYTHTQHEYGGHAVLELVKELRTAGTLCAFVGPKLWTFGLVEDGASVYVRDRGWELDQRGTLDNVQKTSTAAELMAQDILFGAIEGAVSHALHLTGNITKLSPSTWVFVDEQNEAVLLRLSMRVADDGKLSITTSTAPSHLRYMDSSAASDGNTLLTLAPTGCRAILSRDSDNASDGQWRALATEHLLANGIRIAPEHTWVKVQLIDRTATIVEWPAKLCFEHGHGLRAALDDTDWRQFFLPTDENIAFKHPLETAEDWRRNAASRDQHGNGDATTELDVQPPSTLPEHDSMVVNSPPFTLRNAEQQAAASGIYPTPPDGIMPGQLSSQQHSSDAMAVDNPSVDAGLAVQDFSLTMDDPTLRLRASSASDPPPMFNAEDSSNDLFGDMGGEMDFGGDEIGDADFDFFNEEDGADPAAVATDVDESMVEEGNVEETQNHQEEAEDIDTSMAMTKTQDLPLAEEEHAVEMSLDINNADDKSHATDNIIDTIDELFPDQPDAADKPLSPFAIKERLLPPPIPASVSQDITSADERRPSRFNAIAFKENLNIGRRFSELYGPSAEPAGEPRNTSGAMNSDPHQGRKKLAENEGAHEYDDQRSESEDDGSESASSPSDVDVPPKAPWSSKKRKRSDFEANGRQDEVERLLRADDQQSHSNGHYGIVEMHDILDRMQHASKSDVHTKPLPHDEHESLGSVEDLLHLSKMDLVYVAQLVAEQAVTCTSGIVEAIDMLGISGANAIAKGTALRTLVDQALSQVLPSTTPTDIASLALAREPMTRNPPTPATPRPGQPRPPPPRPDTTNLGPDIVAIPPPYMRVQRGNDKYEMLPPALQFWDTLSLAPVNGTKDIRAFCIFPGNEDVQTLVETFLSALGTSYDESKLGSHKHKTNGTGSPALGDFVDGLVPVDLVDDDHSLESALQCYSEACTTLGTLMATTAYTEPERTFVIYIINPFRTHPSATHHLCACFWQLYQAYRKNVPRNRGQPPSDIMLQILPIELLAASDSLVLLEAKHFTSLAQEIYDRCPPNPSFEPPDASSALPNYTAPLFELANPPPKRIGFQLTSEAPGDLLHEGSCLHVAYALSADGFWLTASWVDNTGRYQSSTSYPTSGRTFADVAGEVWERTREIIGGRAVTWRVFIVMGGICGTGMDDSIRKCWRMLVERPRKQAFSVTLLTADLDPVLKLSPPPSAQSTTDDGLQGSAAAGGAGFLTPGSTPQGSTTMTVSPDPSGSGNPPPTPAPSESTPTACGDATDPDAHLVDLTDETWAVLFSPTASQTLSAPLSSNAHDTTPPLCSGALYKRGDTSLLDSPSSCGEHLPSIGVALYWTIQVRPSGAIDEGNVRQAEMTLREVLRMWRGLGVLSRARGLVGSNAGVGVASAVKKMGTCVPVHLVAAVRGAEALDGFLPRVAKEV